MQGRCCFYFWLFVRVDGIFKDFFEAKYIILDLLIKFA